MKMQDSAPSEQAKSRTVVLLTVALAVSAAINIGLTYKVRSFLGAQEDQLAKMEARRLKPGTAVPQLSLRRIESGMVETIRYEEGDRPTVMYVLSPACGWCAKNENSIRQLIAAKRDDYRFLGIVLAEEGTQEFARSHDIGIPLFAGISEEAKKAYKMGGTPQTIVVSPKGVVVANWNGAYLGKQKDAVEDFFKIELPEIDLKSKAAH